MKFRVKADFDGEAKISGPQLVVTWPPYVICLNADNQGRVISVSAEVQVADYKPLLPVLIHPSEESSSLTCPDNPFHNDLLALLQYLESVGAFWCGIHRIAWDRAEFDWIPDSEAEQEELVVWDLRVSQKYPEILTAVDEKFVQTMLERRPLHAYLTVPLAFYREGRNEFRQFRYVQAFVNFYFMIEGLFGGGGPNYRVQENFKSSPTLTKASGDAIELLRNNPRHWEAIRRMLPPENVSFDADGLLDLLVQYRGVLHHYSIKSSKRQGHPFNQREFESLAYVAMAICVKLMPKLIAAPVVPSDVVKPAG